jgi:hypothetical protein
VLRGGFDAVEAGRRGDLERAQQGLDVGAQLGGLAHDRVLALVLDLSVAKISFAPGSLTILVGFGGLARPCFVLRRWPSVASLQSSVRGGSTDWPTIFPSATCTTALIDRLVHHSEIISIEGESYRKREAEQARSSLWPKK